MATKEELARGYAERLRTALDENAEFGRIAGEIDGLTYANTGNPISEPDKLRIVDLIQSELSPPTRSDGFGFLKEAENKHYLLLVQSLRAQLVKK